MAKRPDVEEAQATPEKVEAPPEKIKMLSVRAEKEYVNGTIPAGVPYWRPGEVRKVSLADLQAMQEDAPGNFTIVDAD